MKGHSTVGLRKHHDASEKEKQNHRRSEEQNHHNDASEKKKQHHYGSEEQRHHRHSSDKKKQHRHASEKGKHHHSTEKDKDTHSYDKALAEDSSKSLTKPRQKKLTKPECDGKFVKSTGLRQARTGSSSGSSSSGKKETRKEISSKRWSLKGRQHKASSSDKGTEKDLPQQESDHDDNYLYDGRDPPESNFLYTPVPLGAPSPSIASSRYLASAMGGTTASNSTLESGQYNLKDLLWEDGYRKESIARNVHLQLIKEE